MIADILCWVTTSKFASKTCSKKQFQRFSICKVEGEPMHKGKIVSQHIGTLIIVGRMTNHERIVHSTTVGKLLQV